MFIQQAVNATNVLNYNWL